MRVIVFGTEAFKVCALAAGAKAIERISPAVMTVAIIRNLTDSP
jgi:hypothetical protein